MNGPRVLSLFSGVGGLELGLERAGFIVVGQCEREAFPRAVLAARWPGVWLHDDVRTLTAEMVGDHCGEIDVVCGGFPCQDISSAGRGAGIDGARSGLWKEMRRVIRSLRPRWVIAENVPALRTRGADRVLGDLEGIGYAAWSVVVGAKDVGAPHRRKRVFILAQLADGDGRGREGFGGRRVLHRERPALGDDAHRCSTARMADFPPRPGDFAGWRRVLELDPGLAPATAVERQVRGVADGLPGGMVDPVKRRRIARRWRRQALKAYGNAVVPAVAEVIGAGILRFEREKARERGQHTTAAAAATGDES